MRGEMRSIDRIILHCSDSSFGDAALIDNWHKQRGWKGIGYHYVILNGYPDEASHRRGRPQFWRDGEVQSGRHLSEEGAHVHGANANSIGICLIGKDQFTAGQFASLANLLAELKGRFGNCPLFGHYEARRPADPPKSCPNLDMEWLRQLLLK